MSLKIKITDVHARQILDSRGNPTVEVEVTAETETTGKRSRRESLSLPVQVREDLRQSNCVMVIKIISVLVCRRPWIM